MLSVEELVLMILAGVITFAGVKIWAERTSVFGQTHPSEFASNTLRWQRLMLTVEDARKEIDAR